MELSIVPDTDSDIWDEIVNFSKHSTLFHTWKFLKLMEKHSRVKLFGKSFKSTLLPVKIDDGSGTVGIIPLYYYHTPVTRIVSSPPCGVQCLYLGPILCNFDTLIPRKRYSRLLDFQKELDRFMKEELQANTILFNWSTGLEDSRSFTWSDYTVEPRYTNWMDLRCGEEILWNNLGSRVRRNIKKGEKIGIEFMEGTNNDVEKIYNLLKDTKRIFVPKNYLMEVFDAFCPENLRILTVKYDDELLSGVLMTQYKNKFSFWIGFPKVSIKGMAPNEILYWKTIQWAFRQGSESLEMIGASDPTLFPFKNKFNSEIELFFWMKWNSPFYKLIDGVYKSIR